MEDRKELVERLCKEPLDSRKAAMSIMDLCIDAAEEIETLESLLAESEAARADLGKRLAAAQQDLAETREERDMAIADLRKCESCGVCSYGKCWIRGGKEPCNFRYKGLRKVGV